MSRFTSGPRQSGDDLAYGEYPPGPQRWDRDRFDNFGRGPPPPPEPPRSRFDDEYRYAERDRPPVAVQERAYSRGPPARFAEDRERERIFQDTFNEGRSRRRTDKELFGEVDPRELAQMALQPYKPREQDFDRYGAPPRPGIVRRQSSLDTFDRRPAGPRYDREEHRIPPYTPVPLPIRRPEYDHEEYHYNHHHPDHENYREVEIKRERSIHRRGGRSKSHKSKSSKAPSTVRSSSSSSSSSSSYAQTSRASSPERRVGKKGKTRMPKRLVHRDALHDLAYPYDEEEDFFLLRIALEKDQIDEVIKISEMYKAGDKKTVYKYEEKVSEAPAPPQEFGHEELIRKEYINPPSNFAPSTIQSHHSHHSRHGSSHHSRSRSKRAPSPSIAPSGSRHLSPPRSERSHRTRGRSASEAVVQERRTVVEEERSPAPPVPPQAPEFYEDRRTIIEERAPPPSHGGALVIQERDHRSHRDIESEIRALEAERRALRLERDDQDKMALRVRDRTEEDYQLVEYRDRRDREILPIVERNPSPPRNVIRVEKDRKERRREKQAKKVAIAMATLT
ncbi:hypothetical protein Q7P37_005751 [Cladosporium fusiforme]